MAPLWTAPDGAGAAQRLPALPTTWPQHDGARGIYFNKETQQWCLLIPRDAFAAGREGNSRDNHKTRTVGALELKNLIVPYGCKTIRHVFL